MNFPGVPSPFAPQGQPQQGYPQQPQYQQPQGYPQQPQQGYTQQPQQPVDFAALATGMTGSAFGGVGSTPKLPEGVHLVRCNKVEVVDFRSRQGGEAKGVKIFVQVTVLESTIASAIDGTFSWGAQIDPAHDGFGYGRADMKGWAAQVIEQAVQGANPRQQWDEKLVGPQAAAAFGAAVMSALCSAEQPAAGSLWRAEARMRRATRGGHDKLIVTWEIQPSGTTTLGLTPAAFAPTAPQQPQPVMPTGLPAGFVAPQPAGVSFPGAPGLVQPAAPQQPAPGGIPGWQPGVPSPFGGGR